MTHKTQNSSNSHVSFLYECQLQLNEWFHGTKPLQEMTTIAIRYARLLKQLHFWKKQGLLLPKPTLSLPHTFVFWVDESIIETVLSYENVRGGFQVQESKFRVPDSSSFKGKKLHPRPRRVLLDIGCDSPSLIKQLEYLGIEIVRLWDHMADLLHYEIIELCTAQYIDLLVTMNENLLMPSEEWLDYLMPHRTRLCILSTDLIDNPKKLGQQIYQRAHTKRKYKMKNQPTFLGKDQIMEDQN